MLVKDCLNSQLGYFTVNCQNLVLEFQSTDISAPDQQIAAFLGKQLRMNRADFVSLLGLKPKKDIHIRAIIVPQLDSPWTQQLGTFLSR